MPNSEACATSKSLTILADDTRLRADLTVPARPIGLVLFAHGKGSGRGSPRNRFVARALNQANIATLLLDLLTPEEDVQDADGRFCFDAPFLAQRLGHATDCITNDPAVKGLPIGYCGASTGAAAALIAATCPCRDIAAIVCRGGRTDLAYDATSRVHAPTLLIVGSADRTVLEINRRAIDGLRCRKHLAVVPNATHLFEEPGALEQVGRLARNWFVDAFASHAPNAEPPSKPCMWPNEEPNMRSAYAVIG